MEIKLRVSFIAFAYLAVQVVGGTTIGRSWRLDSALALGLKESWKEIDYTLPSRYLNWQEMHQKT